MNPKKAAKKARKEAEAKAIAQMPDVKMFFPVEGRIDGNVEFDQGKIYIIKGPSVERWIKRHARIVTDGLLAELKEAGITPEDTNCYGNSFQNGEKEETSTPMPQDPPSDNGEGNEGEDGDETPSDENTGT